MCDFIYTAYRKSFDFLSSFRFMFVVKSIDLWDCRVFYGMYMPVLILVPMPLEICFPSTLALVWLGQATSSYLHVTFRHFCITKAAIKYELDELAACKRLVDQCLSDDPDTVMSHASIAYKEQGQTYLGEPLQNRRLGWTANLDQLNTGNLKNYDKETALETQSANHHSILSTCRSIRSPVLYSAKRPRSHF